MSPPAADESARVLVVDDDEVALTALSDVLESAGYRVITQTSPAGAADRAQREGVVAAVIDMNMPVMRGDNLVRLFRSRAHLRDLPIVLVSSERRQELERACQGAMDVRAVSKFELHLRLVPVLRELIAGARRRGCVERPWADAGAPAAGLAGAAAKGSRLTRPAFARGLSEGVSLCEALWQELLRGRCTRAPRVAAKLADLERQARGLGLVQAALLLRALGDVMLAVPPTGAVPLWISADVESALTALLALCETGTGDCAPSAEPTMQRLNRACAELRSTH